MKWTIIYIQKNSIGEVVELKHISAYFETEFEAIQTSRNYQYKNGIVYRTYYAVEL